MNDKADNCVRLMEKSFENVCNMLQDMGVPDPHALTVFQFYSKIRYFKEKMKPKKHGS